MRDEEQESTAVRYIESNPVKACLCRVPEDWLFSSCRWRDRFGWIVLPNVESEHA